MYLESGNSTGAGPDAQASGFGPSASLTYEPFFGLREKAFSLSADPRFLFRSPAHAPAFDALLAGIRRREGLIVLTGEIGTGKTTLCRSVLQHLDQRTFAAFVPDPFVSREDLLKTLLLDFGVISIGDLTRGRFNGASRSELSYSLYEFLDSLVPLQAFAVLVIDETQNLALPLLEEIRILSELERREKLLQVVLVGQPELQSSLRLPQMRQVDQRISVRCELSALEADGVAGYIHHRLIIAGLGEGRAEFTPAALDAVYQGSAGVPRVINRICDRALERAYSARSLRIEAQFVWDAVDDLGPSTTRHARSTAEESSPPVPVVESPAPVIQAPAVVEAPAPALQAPASVVEAPPALPALESVPIAGTHTETVAPALEDFASEAEPSVETPIGTPGRGYRWAAVAAASIVAVVGSVGVPAWYLRAQMVDENVVATLRPLVPPRMTSQPRLELPEVERAVLLSPQDGGAALASAATGAAGGGYTIVVASFTSRARADRLVEELTTAGYKAGVAERDWGPPRGRLFQVNVGSYASAIEVQRDLQHIREMPGGYRDARIVEQQ